MTQKTLNTVFTKVATQDKAARVLSLMIGVNKQIKNVNKQAVQTKVASIVDGVMKKKAAATDDVVSSIGYSSLPYVSFPASLGGLYGMFSDPASKEDEDKWNKDRGLSYVPGVGNYRYVRRHKKQLVDDEGKTPHFWSQSFGPLTSALLLAGAGAATGGGLVKLTGGGNRDAGLGALGGAAVGAAGAGLTGLAAAIKAAVDRRRTEEEQKEYTNSPTTKEWLLPGVGTYNAWKTTGRVLASDDKRGAKKKDKKDEEKA